MLLPPCASCMVVRSTFASICVFFWFSLFPSLCLPSCDRALSNVCTHHGCPSTLPGSVKAANSAGLIAGADVDGAWSRVLLLFLVFSPW